MCRADDIWLSCAGLQEATDIFGDVEDLLGQYEAAKADRVAARDAELDDDLNPEDLDDAVAEAALRSNQVGFKEMTCTGQEGRTVRLSALQCTGKLCSQPPLSASRQQLVDGCKSVPALQLHREVYLPWHQGLGGGLSMPRFMRAGTSEV